MVASPGSDLRSVFVGLLVLLLAVAGAGRGIAAGFEAADPRVATFGVAGPICHSGRDAPSRPDPARPADSDCCNDCALLAAAVLPLPPDLARPSVVTVPQARILSASSAPETGGFRSPRQARAPPLD